MNWYYVYSIIDFTLSFCADTKVGLSYVRNDRDLYEYSNEQTSFLECTIEMNMEVF